MKVGNKGCPASYKITEQRWYCCLDVEHLGMHMDAIGRQFKDDPKKFKKRFVPRSVVQRLGLRPPKPTTRVRVSPLLPTS